MNINKISTRNITTRITHLLKREEVVQAVYKNGEPVSFSTAPISAEQFKELIPGIQQIKIITKELAPNIFQRLTDTYTIVQNSGKVIKKLTLNYKNQSVTFITNMMDNSNKLRQKFVAKYENIFLIPKIPSKFDFDTFPEAYADADKMFISEFRNGKVQEAFMHHNPKNNNEPADVKFFFKNGKLTEHAKFLKTKASKKRNLGGIEPVDLSQSAQKTPSAATIVLRPLKNGKLMRLCLKKGFAPQFETLPVTKKEFQNGIQDLTEIREIFSLPFQDKLRSKLFDILTLVENENKIKIIKDYRKQKTKLLWSKYNTNGQLEKHTVFYLNPQNYIELNNPGVNTIRALYETLKYCDSWKITYFSGGKPIKYEFKNHSKTFS